MNDVQAIDEQPTAATELHNKVSRMCKRPEQRVAVLIDDDNVMIAAENGFGKRIDYAKLLHAMNGREIVRAILYRPASVQAQFVFPPSLLRFLELRLGIEIKTPPKNVDCWLTVDAIALADKVDVVALVGGDGDYEPLVHFLKARGCRVEVWSWPHATSHRLREAADRYLPLSEEVLLDRSAA